MVTDISVVHAACHCAQRGKSRILVVDKDIHHGNGEGRYVEGYVAVGVEA